MKIIGLILTLTLFGCTMAPITPIETASSATSRIIDRNYVVGVQREAFVGEGVAKIKDYYVKKTVEPRLVSSADFIMSGRFLNGSGANGTIIGTIDQKHAIAGVVPFENKEYYAVDFNNNRCNPCVLVSPDTGNPIKMGWYQSGYFMPKKSFTDISPSDLKFTRVASETIDSKQGYINQELIYSGVSNGAIHLSYREYTPDNLARPAFFQDVTYDASAPEIRFRNIKIRITQATSQSIIYTVLDDGLH